MQRFVTVKTVLRESYLSIWERWRFFFTLFKCSHLNSEVLMVTEVDAVKTSVGTDTYVCQ